MHFADIKNDIAFRKIFGNDTKKEIIISFLNAVLTRSGSTTITDVEILDPYQLPRIVGEKATILDVRAKDQAGNTYIVEMQVTNRRGLDKRVVYYGAKTYVSQLDASEEFYTLKPVVLIGILDFEYLDSPDYISRHLILDAITGEHKLKDLEFTFIELPKFTKSESELTTLVEKWVYFIKNAPNLTVIPASVDDTGLYAAYEAADRHLWTKRELEQYSYVRLREADETARDMFVREQGMQQGLQQGLQQGFHQVVQNAIAKGYDNQTIADITGLSVEEIQQIRETISKE